jgi:hypothetical protein
VGLFGSADALIAFASPSGDRTPLSPPATQDSCDWLHADVSHAADLLGQDAEAVSQHIGADFVRLFDSAFAVVGLADTDTMKAFFS